MGKGMGCRGLSETEKPILGGDGEGAGGGRGLSLGTGEGEGFRVPLVPL